MAAVSFPIYSATEAYLILKDDKDFRVDEKAFYNCLDKSAVWLSKNFDYNVCNQETGSLMALYNIHLISGKEEYLESVNKKIDNLLSFQSNEGWFLEYSGSDIGYSTLTVDYLSKYYQKSGDERVVKPLSKLIKFLSYFVHPNQTMGGEYSSRNNEFVIPSGFELTSDMMPDSQIICSKIRSGFSDGSILTPSDMDDVYFCMNHHSFFQASINHKNFNNVITKKPFFTKYFKKARKLVFQNKNYYCVVGGQKGGVMRIYDINNNKLIFSDSGYIGHSKRNQIISTQWSEKECNVIFLENDNKMIIEGNFRKLNFVLPSSFKMLASRIALPIVAKSTFIRKKIYSRLRKSMILTAPTLPLKFKREISFNKNTIEVKDSFSSDRNFLLKDLHNIPQFTTMYGQSKNFFQKQDLDFLDINSSINLAEKFNDKGTLHVKKKVFVSNNKIEIKVE